MTTISTRLRTRALTVIQARLATLLAQWEAGGDAARQVAAMQDEAHRLVGTALQAQQLEVVRAGRELEQRLGRDASPFSQSRDARAQIAEALYALQATVAQAVTQTTNQATQSASEAPQGEQAATKLPLKGLRVLLVEDSGDTAEAFQEGLQLAGCDHVASCGTIAAAKALLAPGKPPFDIALIDHNLGRERGSTLAAWMRQQPHLVGTRRISYSASPRERVVGESAPGDFHAVLELRGLRQLIADLVTLRASLGNERQ